MSLYCTVQDVRNALTPGGNASESETYNSTGDTAAELEDWQIEDAIVEAMTIIDMYVKKRYQIILTDVEQSTIPPVDPPVTETVNVAPTVIRMWTRSLAAWYATLTKRQGKDLEERDPIELRKQHIMSSLLAIGNRQLDLDLPLSDPDDVQSGVAVYNLYEGDLFTLADFGLGYGSSPQVYVPYRNSLWWA